MHPWEATQEPASNAPTNLATRFERLWRWEFWPSWLYYIPIIVWLIWLSLKYRSLTAFTAANSALEAGGVVGEKKHRPLLALQTHAPDLVAELKLLNADSERESAAMSFAEIHDYPVVLKPNIGQRGRGVMIAKNADDIAAYLGKFAGDVIVQRYARGQEFGVFIVRKPEKHGVQPKVEILSIVHKTFPTVTGDGVQSLRDLILKDPRARLIANLLFQRWARELDTVPERESVVQLVEIGAHCRGSLFLNANHLISEALIDSLTRLSDAVPGYTFGRMDLRVPSQEDFVAGKNLKIIEMNGVTAESAHIYHPGTSLWSGYRDMFKQWALAYELGSAYAQQGVATTSLPQLYRLWREDLKRGKNWF